MVWPDREGYRVSGDVYPNAVFINPGGPYRWLSLHLEGTRANRSAVGARVEVRLETPQGSRSIFRTVGTGGSFGSSSLRLELGLGDAIAIREVRVRWPVLTGWEQHFEGLELDRSYRLREGELKPLSAVLGGERVLVSSS